MPLTLSPRSPISIPVEVEAVLPETTRGLSLADVSRLPITQGNASLCLADLFRVDGVTDDLQHIWDGDLPSVKSIGRGLRAGSIRVEGSAGTHVGAQMTGGEICVAGHAGDWAGAEMQGGSLRIGGNAGHAVGGAYRGQLRGMTGGQILIGGTAGDEIGRLMRRGLIAITGSCGDFCGSRMIAGTIVVGGAAGDRAGALMKRGTVALLGGVSACFLPTFQFAGSFRLGYLARLAAVLRRAGFPHPDRLTSGLLNRWCGDLLAIGKGEILVPGN